MRFFSLFPAYAGVILRQPKSVVPACTFPRIRGGDPVSSSVAVPVSIFSLHTRG